MNDYNGWKNHKTWKVAVWLENDEDLYSGIVEFMKKDNPDPEQPYMAFLIASGLEAQKTPDGVAYADSELDRKALGQIMRDLS